MSDKPVNISTLPKNYEYRKKKQDKGKRFSRDKRNSKIDECDDLNDLPDGIFDKKSDFNRSDFLNEKKDTKDTKKEEQSNTKIEDCLEYDEHEETFDESYFEPVVIK
jgi:hypothetical protein